MINEKDFQELERLPNCGYDVIRKFMEEREQILEALKFQELYGKNKEYVHLPKDAYEKRVKDGYELVKLQQIEANRQKRIKELEDEITVNQDAIKTYYSFETQFRLERLAILSKLIDELQNLGHPNA